MHHTPVRTNARKYQRRIAKHTVSLHDQTAIEMHPRKTEPTEHISATLHFAVCIALPHNEGTHFAVQTHLPVHLCKSKCIRVTIPSVLTGSKRVYLSPDLVLRIADQSNAGRSEQHFVRKLKARLEPVSIAIAAFSERSGPHLIAAARDPKYTLEFGVRNEQITAHRIDAHLAISANCREWGELHQLKPAANSPGKKARHANKAKKQRVWYRVFEPKVLHHHFDTVI
jgi:hypothetical protein